ncbi:hypothetical protein GBK04_19800 [Cytophagaceae bacterium SJW1-29]|uniref:Immunity protein 49 n=2 Tax=Salmonirosea aquatica TaxID=2654236 RepID=A0A7C9FPU4_9BACT|nr:hypothetical protein [Cytophagaceae bacterium SJW1-29]
MTKKESLAILDEQYSYIVNFRLPRLMGIFREKPHEFDRLTLPILWADHEKIALYRLLFEKNIPAAKQEFYNCGTLTTYGVLRFGYWPKDKKAEYIEPDVKVDYMGFVSHFSYLLLSDCEALIQQYSTLRHQWWDEKTKDGLLVYARAIQCILLDDWESLEKHLIQFDKQAKRYKSAQHSKEFFIGMLEKDIGKVKRSIETMCEKRYSRHNPFLANLIALPAAGYAKLAWLKGMQVQIDSPLVPMELMPIAPLEEYVNPYERFWRLGED